ncbi:MAG: carboxypeptidase-like regulatory domain-containing protein [Saprospiraceae bacterium]
MNKEEAHINELLKRWISGDVTAAEEAELFRMAQSRPELADAMAGYSQYIATDHAPALARLRLKINPKSSRPYGWLRVAAAVLLLLTLAWWLLPLTPESSSSVAETIETPQRVDVQTEPLPEEISHTTAPEVATTEAETPIASAPTQTTQSPLPKPSVIAPAEPSSGTTSTEEAYSQTSTTLTKQVPVTAPVETIEESDYAASYPSSTTQPLAPATDAMARQKPTATSAYDPTLISNNGVPTAAAGYQLVEGRVTDSTGEPLIGVSIAVAGTPIGTVTDVEGNFLVSIPEKGATLTISYTGFETTSLLVDQNEEWIDIQLNEGMALEEVVVTGLGVKKKQQSTASAVRSLAKAEPIDGEKAFKKYIADNIPQINQKERFELKFFIDTEGRPTRIQVVSSSNNDLNTKIIDLLQNYHAGKSRKAALLILYNIHWLSSSAKSYFFNTGNQSGGSFVLYTDAPAKFRIFCISDATPIKKLPN